MPTSDPVELEQRPQGRRQWSGWFSSVVLPVAVVLAIIGVLVYFQTRSSDGERGGFYGAVDLPPAKNATAKTPSAEGDRAAPDFLLQTLDGASLRLSDLQGQPLLVNFWASWCATCRQETPQLIETYDRFKARGLLVVGVNLQEANERARKFVDEWQIGYPVVMDRRGQVARTWRIGGPTQGLPASYFIDPRGVVQKVVWGPLRAKDIEDGMALIMPGG